MAYICAVLYLACVYIRPGEIIPGWVGFPFVQVLAGFATVALLGSLILRPRSIWDQPHDFYVVGFFVAALISNPAWGWLGGFQVTLFELAPAVFCYFLVRASIESERHLRWTAYVLIALTLFQALNGIVQYQTGFGLGDVRSLTVPDAGTGAGNEVIRRIRGTGIFNDPNDLALALVIVIPFLLTTLARRGSRLSARMVATIALCPIVLALFYTNSRGGLLGFVASCVPMFYSRFGRVAGTGVAVITVMLLLVAGPSRASGLSAQEESAQGRVQAWSEGLQMFKSSPVFGIGFNRYTEYYELVAHNSFVHALSELGFVGAFFFTGMAYWYFRSTRSPKDVLTRPGPRSDVATWGAALRQSGIGLAVCALFLSRQYNIIVFIWVALSANYRRLEVSTGRDAATYSLRIPQVALIEVAMVAATYVAIRVLSVWPAI